MKKSLTTVVVMLSATLTFAQKMQEKNIPASVISTFQKNYPTVKSVKWDKEGEQYEANFDLQKADNSVLIDAQGNIVETEVEIELRELPTSILEYVKLHYAGKQAKESAKITDAKGAVTYEVEIKGMDLIFDSKGKFIKELKG